MEKFERQILLSTHVDSQGEKLCREDLEAIFAQIQNLKVPLGQGHDATKDYAGYFENAEIIYDTDDDSECQIIADVYCDQSKLEEVLGGFSYSAIQGLFATGEDPSIGIYFPFPFYNDDDFLKEACEIEMPLIIGKWIKKDASPIAIAIITTVSSILLSPLWARYFENNIAPKLDSLTRSKKLSDKVGYDLAIKCKDEYGHNFTMHFTSKKKNLKSIRPDVVKTGISKTTLFIEQSEKAKKIGIAMARLIYNNKYSRYDILNITFKNGDIEDNF